MTPPHIVIDTNVFVAALCSRRGAAHHLLLLAGLGYFEIHLSVPLVLEYEAAAKKLLSDIPLEENDIDDIIDYLVSIAHHHRIHFLWRPFLRDPKDDMVLELAVAAGCDYIVTYNKRDFHGVETFGIHVLTPREFLARIGALP